MALLVAFLEKSPIFVDRLQYGPGLGNDADHLSAWDFVAPNGGQQMILHECLGGDGITAGMKFNFNVTHITLALFAKE